LIAKRSENALAIDSPSSGEIARFTTTGVGIGTSSPSAKLHLYSGTGGKTLVLENPNNDYAGIEFRANGLLEGRIKGANDGMHFYSDTGATVKTMHLDPSGYVSLTKSIKLGDDTRTASAAGAGTLRWSSSEVQVSDGTDWVAIYEEPFSATGGTKSTYSGYTYHAFTSSGTFTAVTSGIVDILVVGGGGGAGTSNGAAGGGAGGLIQSTGVSISSGAYTVIVGAGGPHSNGDRWTRATNGVNSSVNGLEAIGGGASGSESYDPQAYGAAGGSGGGGVRGYTGGSGTTGQGYAGGSNVSDGSPYYSGGGGGGASAAGTNGSSSTMGNGGNGKQYLDWATATSTVVDGGYYAGGGAAGAYYSTSPGIGGTPGLGGGGQGGSNKTQAQLSGVGNTGGGGGGHGNYGVASGNGGSGIVIIRYAV